MKTMGWLLLVMVLSAPVALVLTLASSKFWGWFESRTGIESLGHSGPADWCFVAVYAVCVVVAAGATFACRRKSGRNGNKSGT